MFVILTKEILTVYSYIAYNKNSLYYGTTLHPVSVWYIGIINARVRMVISMVGGLFVLKSLWAVAYMFVF
jgi:hypothetical protein